MSSNTSDDRLRELLALLPAGRHPTALSTSPDYLTGVLCAGLCLAQADEPMRLLDAHWGDDWAEGLVDADLLDELVEWLEERWESLCDAMATDRLLKDPDALPLADALPWAVQADSLAADSRRHLPTGARDWAAGFTAAGADLQKDATVAELLLVINALTLAPGSAAFMAYVEAAYDDPQAVDARALLDDALFAAQDLRLTTRASRI
jgi:hypothetical protein